MNSRHPFAALACAALLSFGCSGMKLWQSHPYTNYADEIAAPLKPGMTEAEVEAATAKARKDYVIKDTAEVIQPGGSFYTFEVGERVPFDLPQRIHEGASIRTLEFWTNHAGGHTGSLRLVFEGEPKRLVGWGATSSEYNREKYLHERITDLVRHARKSYAQNTRAELRALLGAPEATLPVPARQDPEARGRCMWFQTPTDVGYNDGDLTQLFAGDAPSQRESAGAMDVYGYEFAPGQRRRVYLVYGERSGDKLVGLGYDHVQEELDRYRAQQDKQK